MSTPAGDDLVGDATIRVDGDTDPATRALRQFSRDAQGRLRDLRGRFVAESTLINRTITNNTPTLTVNTTPATNAINQFTRDANGRLRDVHGRFIRAGDDISNSLTRAAGGGDRFNLSLRGLTNVAARVGPVLARVGLGLGAVGAAAGSTAPLLAGIVTTLENIAPAGAVAVTGMLAVTQASVAIKLGMVGVEDAVSAALDPSKAEEFNEALKKLSPNARAFAEGIRELQPALQSLQQGVQNRLFAGFADELSRLADSVLPVVRTNLNTTATTLNRMALGASAAARQLATDGTLGKAMAGANKGLSNLQKIPGQVVTGLGQLAAAGAPAFDRLTKGAADAATRIGDRLSTAFKSGALENAVNTAIDLIKDLGTVFGNVFSILGNIMAPVQAAGGGLVGVLLEITGALKQATASKGFQDAITSLASVMATLARTVGPLLGQALAAIGPIFTTLGPPVERLITSLGTALSPIIAALGPVLATAATAIGTLVDAISPLLPVIGNLVAALLPALTPLLDAVNQVFMALAPVIEEIAGILEQTLSPILAALPGIIAPLAKILADRLVFFLQLLGDILIELGPSLVTLGQSAGELLVAVAPVVEAVADLSAQLLQALMPLLLPLIDLIGQLAAVLANQLARYITDVVVPAVSALAALLSGDFSTALDFAKRALMNWFLFLVDIFTLLPLRLGAALAQWAGRMRARANEAGAALVVTLSEKASQAVGWLRGLPGRAGTALASLAGSLRSRASEAGRSMVSVISQRIGEAVSTVASLPGRAASALGNLGSRLYNSGRALIQGFINGILSKIGDVSGAVGSVLSEARDLLPFSPAKEGPFSGKGWTLFSGQAISEALAEGIAQRAAAVERAARMVAATAQTTISGPALAVAPAAMTDLGVGTVRAASAGGAPTVVNVTVNVTNRGVLGSPFEVENWLIGALDNARRTGRLPAMNRR